MSIPHTRLRRFALIITELYILMSAAGEFQNAESCGSAAR
jgi:hypothetical protein